MNIEELITKQRALKERILVKENQIENHMFGDMMFYRGMSFNSFKDSDLILAHAYVHKSFSMAKPALKHNTLREMHDKIVSEFTKRNIKHTVFDLLDR